MNEDILSAALSLEQTYYNEGHTLGSEDGTRAGQIEGRRLGLEKGFDKFSSLARLHGRAIVWNSQWSLETSTIAESTGLSSDETHSRVFLPELFDASYSLAGDSEIQDTDVEPPAARSAAGDLRRQSEDGSVVSRVAKHVAVLYALTEVESLSMENTEQAVSEFDDRYRRAVTKAGMIERIVGERVDGFDIKGGGVEGVEGDIAGEGELEDIALRARRNNTVRSDNLKLETAWDDAELEIEIR